MNASWTMVQRTHHRLRAGIIGKSLLASVLMAGLGAGLAGGMSGCSHRYPDATDGYVEDRAREVNYQVIPVTAPLVRTLKSQMDATSARRKADAAPSAEMLLQHYRIQPMDQILVRISVQNESGGMTQVFPVADVAAKDETIGEDGMVHLPVLGNVSVAGKTIQQARDYIVQELTMARVYQKPHVEIEITGYDSQFSIVTGEVENPGRVALSNRPLTVADAIQQAGGVKPSADLERAALRRADGTVIPIDLVALLNDGDMRQNYQLRQGDSLSIPDGIANNVYILGETKPAGTLSEGNMMPLRHGRATLAEAVSRFQTVDRDYADYAHVYVIRNAVSEQDIESARKAPLNGQMANLQLASLDNVNIYKLDASMPHGWALAAEFPLQPRDVVYIAPRPMADWGRFVTLLLPSGLGGLVGAAIIAGSR